MGECVCESVCACVCVDEERSVHSATEHTDFIYADSTAEHVYITCVFHTLCSTVGTLYTQHAHYIMRTRTNSEEYERLPQPPAESY